jgi:hypothetical protein
LHIISCRLAKILGSPDEDINLKWKERFFKTEFEKYFPFVGLNYQISTTPAGAN